MTGEMVVLTPHESAVLSRLVQFGRLPVEHRRKMLDELSGDARMVGEVVLDRQKYDGSPEHVRATVDRFDQWHEANIRIGRMRANRRRSARSQ
jgi:hypothetical protein